MGTVQDVMRGKAREVHSVESGATVLEAAELMNAHKVGSVVVLHGVGGEMVGILTERDILTRVVAQRRDPASTRVAEVMTRSVLTCRPSTKLNEARLVMRERRIRHLPVVDQGELVGMLSIGDLNQAEHSVLVETIQTMETYIAGGSAAPV